MDTLKRPNGIVEECTATSYTPNISTVIHMISMTLVACLQNKPLVLHFSALHGPIIWARARPWPEGVEPQPGPVRQVFRILRPEPGPARLFFVCLF